MAKTFEILYQTANAATGKVVQFDVYKPDKSIDAVQSGVGAEVGTTGRYHKSFDVDAPGWFVEISDDQGGKAISHIDQDKYDAHGITGGLTAVITAVADVQTAIDAVAAAVTGLNTSLGTVEGKVDDVKTVADGITTAVGALATTLAAMDVKIDLLGNPPMVG